MAALVTGAVAVYVVKQVAATRPTIEWRSKDGGGKVEFPASVVKE